jgi:hypothetical protein
VTGTILRGTDAGRVVACHPCPGFSVEVSVGATGARCTALRHLRPWHSERRRVEVPETRQTVAWEGCCGQWPQVCRGPPWWDSYLYCSGSDSCHFEPLVVRDGMQVGMLLKRLGDSIVLPSAVP